VALGATDMRKGFDGIYGIVRDWLALERAAGICFCFANARRTGYGIKGWIRL
jgi:transposase